MSIESRVGRLERQVGEAEDTTPTITMPVDDGVLTADEFDFFVEGELGVWRHHLDRAKALQNAQSDVDAISWRINSPIALHREIVLRGLLRASQRIEFDLSKYGLKHLIKFVRSMPGVEYRPRNHGQTVTDWTKRPVALDFTLLSEKDQRAIERAELAVAANEARRWQYVLGYATQSTPKNKDANEMEQGADVNQEKWAGRDRFYPAEAAAYAGVTLDDIQTANRAGVLLYEDAGGTVPSQRYYLTREQLDAWIENGRPMNQAGKEQKDMSKLWSLKDMENAVIEFPWGPGVPYRTAAEIMGATPREIRDLHDRGFIEVYLEDEQLADAGVTIESLRSYHAKVANILSRKQLTHGEAALFLGVDTIGALDQLLHLSMPTAPATGVEAEVRSKSGGTIALDLLVQYLKQWGDSYCCGVYGASGYNVRERSRQSQEAGYFPHHPSWYDRAIKQATTRLRELERYDDLDPDVDVSDSEVQIAIQKAKVRNLRAAKAKVAADGVRA